MTAPDPTVVASVGAEAVEAGANAAWMLTRGRNLTVAGYENTIARTVLAAALPHLRAQWTAEVDAALRDEHRTYAWAADLDFYPEFATGYTMAADYLRDTLAGDGGEGGNHG